MRTIQFILTLLILTMFSQAQMADLNLTRMRYGEPVQFYSARMLGLAGSGLASQGSVGNALENPALIFPQQGTLTLTAGLMTNKLVEDRQFPYYDSFSGFNDFGSYSYNSNYHFAPYFQLGWILPLAHPVAVQAGRVPFLDFRYKYAEEVRDPFDKTDKLLGYNWIDQSGVLNQTFLAIGTQVVSGLKVGLKLGFLSGTIDSTMKIEPRVEGNLFSEQRIDRRRTLSSTPVLFNLGLHYRVSERLSVGAFAQLPYTLKWDNHLKGDSMAVAEEIDYPLSLGGGLDYRFQNILQARVFMDFIYSFSGNFKDSRTAELHYRDTFTLRGGVEHLFFKKQMPFRIGFSYATLPYNYNLANTWLTLGTGWYFSRWHVDLAAGLNHQEFYQPDLFPDTIYGLDARTDLDRVQWTNYFFRFDVTINLF